jgi:hypothetical protein
MKTLAGFVVTLFMLAVAFAPPKSNAAQGNYTVKLVAPVAGQVLYGGQKIMVEWQHTVPRNFGECESEAWLSIDGGVTFSWIAFLAPTSTSLLWTVPNTPTNSAVLDIRFGCEVPYYPESYAPQLASMFVIAKSPLE